MYGSVLEVVELLGKMFEWAPHSEKQSRFYVAVLSVKLVSPVNLLVVSRCNPV